MSRAFLLRAREQSAAQMFRGRFRHIRLPTRVGTTREFGMYRGHNAAFQYAHAHPVLPARSAVVRNISAQVRALYVRMHDRAGRSRRLKPVNTLEILDVYFRGPPAPPGIAHLDDRCVICAHPILLHTPPLPTLIVQYTLDEHWRGSPSGKFWIFALFTPEVIPNEIHRLLSRRLFRADNELRQPRRWTGQCRHRRISHCDVERGVVSSSTCQSMDALNAVNHHFSAPV
jgi:hypothetical protein